MFENFILAIEILNNIPLPIIFPFPKARNSQNETKKE